VSQTITSGATALARPYPWVYRPSAKGRAGLVLCGLVGLALAALAVACALAFPEPFWGWRIKAVFIVCGAASALLGAYTIACAFVCATVLTERTLERRDLFWRRNLKKADIAGYRVIERENNFATLIAVPRSKAAKPLKVLLFSPDEEFQRWFEDIPDLDVRDAEETHKQLMASPRLGASPKEREARITLYSRIAAVANALGGAIMFWVWFFPRPYDLAIASAVAAPLVGVALVVSSRGALAFESPKTDPRKDVIGLLVAGFAVLIRAVSDIQVLDWRDTLGPAAALAVVALGATWALRESIRDNQASRIVFAMGFAFIGGADLLEANMLLDRAKPSEFHAKALGKHVSSGKHTSYDVELSPWGPRREAADVDVGRRLYGRIQVDQAVCVFLWPGALNIRWFDVDTCPAKRT
jgi:hypothetical protein